MELTPQEMEVIAKFRVTGFFSKTPKQNVTRRAHQVWRDLELKGTQMSMEDMVQALAGLAEKGLLREDEKEIIHLTDEGYNFVCQTDFK
jgi:hypothetical protein